MAKPKPKPQPKKEIIAASPKNESVEDSYSEIEEVSSPKKVDTDSIEESSGRNKNATIPGNFTGFKAPPVESDDDYGSMEDFEEDKSPVAAPPKPAPKPQAKPIQDYDDSSSEISEYDEDFA